MDDPANCLARCLGGASASKTYMNHVEISNRAGHGKISSMKKGWLCPKIPKNCMFIEKMRIKQ